MCITHEILSTLKSSLSNLIDLTILVALSVIINVTLLPIFQLRIISFNLSFITFNILYIDNKHVEMSKKLLLVYNY